jgi:formamidopyrimidine-DNA glycosylase
LESGSQGRAAPGRPSPGLSGRSWPEADRSDVSGLGRRGKFGLIHTDRGDTLVFHLGMSGKWRVDPDEIHLHDHLLIETDDGRRIALNDPRRFGSVDLVATDSLRSVGSDRRAWERSRRNRTGAAPRPLRAERRR